MDDSISRQAEQQGRVFKEIVVEYPSYSTYPEYEGKPYFSIKYMENGQEFIGYGTYKPEVLSEYLREYFTPSVQLDVPDTNVGKCSEIPNSSETIYRQAAIDAMKKISFSHWFECGEYLSEDTREIEIINSNKALEAIEALPPAQPEQN